MFRNLATSVKQFFTAIVLLLAVFVSAEVVLQLKAPPPTTTISTCVDPELQSLLAPSSTTHHEMLRLHSQQVSQNVKLETNSLGLRGDEPSQTKPADTLRVLLLGDETILGPQLEGKFTVGARLREFLVAATGMKIEVINAGVPGFCPLLSWLQYHHQLRHLNPDVVVLHFDMNDVADDAVYRRSLKDAGDQQICVNCLLAADRRQQNAAARMLSNSALVRLLQRETGFGTNQDSPMGGGKLNERYAWTTTSRSDLRLQIQHALSPIERFVQAAEQGGFRLLVSSSPTPWQVATSDAFPGLEQQIVTNSTWPLLDDIPYRILEGICDRASVPFCNSAAKFREFSQPARLFENDDAGLSAYGSALYARQIASILLSDPQLAGLFSDRSNVSVNPRPNF